MSNSQPTELWYTRCGAATASALAIENGFLQEEFSGPDTLLHSLRDSHQLSVRNSHYNHSQSGMFREGGNIPPIWAKGQGQDTVVVGITWLDEYQGILVRADSPILQLKDLKGKKVGIPDHKGSVIDFQRGAAQHGFSTALKLAGLSKQEVTWVDVIHPVHDKEDGPRVRRPELEEDGHSLILQALDRGEVDAVFLRFTSGLKAAHHPGYRELININTLKDPLLRVNNGTPRPITVDRAFLNRNPELVARYLAALIRTADWASKNPIAVLDALNAGRKPELRSWIPLSHGKNFHQSFLPQLSEQYIAGLTEQKNWLREWGYIAHDFEVQNWIDPKPLQRAHELIQQAVAA